MKHILPYRLLLFCRTSFAGLALLLTIAGAASAAPPTNDDQNNPEIVVGPGADSIERTLAEATRQSGEQPHGGGQLLYRTVWFQWTAPATSPVLFRVINPQGFDPAMAIYNAATMGLVARNNDTASNRPRCEFMAIAGTTYKIVVGVFNSSASPGGTFTFSWDQNPTPTNDNLNNSLQLSEPSGEVTMTNLNATLESSEPVFGSGKTVWLQYRNESGHDYSVTFDSRWSFDVQLDTTFGVYTGNTIEELEPVVLNENTPTSPKSRVTFLARTGETYRIAVDSAAAQPAPGNIVLRWDKTKITYNTDFGTSFGAGGRIHYDEAADITVFRPSEGVWYYLDSSNNAFHAYQFGANGDTPVAGDYDGDGRADYAVTRNVGGQLVWYVRNSFDQTLTVFPWGLSSDRPVPGDYDADGRMDFGVYRPSNGTWYIWPSYDGDPIFQQFGQTGDIPVIGDFGGTSVGTDFTVFRPSDGTWYITDGTAFRAVPFGLAGDMPVASDYDYDGKSDIAVFRPSEGNWYYLRSGDDGFEALHWGLPGDIPQPADFDNNSNDPADFVVFRPSDATWYILGAQGTPIRMTQFGLGTDIPVSSPTILSLP